jgi:hypothetical protein
MRASSILAVSAFSLALSSAVASADPTALAAPGAKAARPATRGAEITLDPTICYGKRQRPMAAVEVSRIVPSAPLAELRNPVVESIAAAVDHEPF